ncbi:ATP-binding protein [Bradyrhizobium sp. AS23.2]|uniref:ATP-binding protein n=1 Tax=Bradyrhizobium sp. AS23.2 TaxID=1680155 RepID=UPI00093BBC6F|nr:hypothetical protein AC630_00160 [Bradyrhizobium sp. AS23.2]
MKFVLAYGDVPEHANDAMRGTECTGLGLWISYGIVREHGGELLATNEPGGGATFSLALQAAPPVPFE